MCHSTDEVWMPLSRFEGIVEASNIGRVRRKEYKVHQGNGNGHLRTVSAKIFKPRKHPWGYKYIEFSLRGEVHQEFVHRLVAEAFLGSCPANQYVLHGDNDPTNNRIENLRYGTPSENCKDKLIHGTQPHGEAISWSKLKEDDILDIRMRRNNGAPYADIANIYNLSENYVWQICTGTKWKYVGGMIEPLKRTVKFMSDKERSTARQLRRKGRTITEIANVLGVSRTQIHNEVRNIQ